MTAVGGRVCYILDAEDADGINTRRGNFQHHQATSSHGKHPHARGGSGAPGFVAHVGLEVGAGDHYPADVIMGSATMPRHLSMRVLLPGSDVQWVVNVPQGDDPGCWHDLHETP